MSFIVFLLAVLLLGGFQYMMGRKRKAILGAILPIGVVLFWLVLFLTGNISLTSIGDIVSPLLLFVGLIFLYADGEARVK